MVCVLTNHFVYFCSKYTMRKSKFFDRLRMTPLLFFRHGLCSPRTIFYFILFRFVKTRTEAIYYNPHSPPYFQGGKVGSYTSLFFLYHSENDSLGASGISLFLYQGLNPLFTVNPAFFNVQRPIFPANL